MRIADVHAHIFPDKIAEKAGEAVGQFYETKMAHIPFLNILMKEETQAGISMAAVSSGCGI